jgi:D-tagatose-1,6-bisphosphate aldolase subunit GatZ/KbaZ
MNDILTNIVHRQEAGEAVGITSVCSAHPMVLQAAAAQAVADGSAVLVEATSNQVDQFGGYTGMRPSDFKDLVFRIADREGLPRARVILGGDHLGPNSWRGRPADEAMQLAEHLVRTYVQAGYTKLHLDCSMPCADDPGPPSEEVVAARAARLAAVAERAALDGSDLRYVVGTEVPVPGGARETIESLSVTSPDAARGTLAAHEEAFTRAGAQGAWQRVVALVVQPGVEFDAARVVDYAREGTGPLRKVLDDHPGLVFEAHSTDYQTVESLRWLVEDRWAVLKVGPGLTFALREALFALAGIEEELVGDAERSHLVAVVERAMLAQPQWWQDHYEGDDDAQRLARRYSYSDRIRYYWPHRTVAAAQSRLLTNLRTHAVPLSMLSAYLPDQYARVRSGELTPDPAALAVDRVRDVLRGYAVACNP